MRDRYVEVLVKRVLPETKKVKIVLAVSAGLTFLVGALFSRPIFLFFSFLFCAIYYFKAMRMDVEFEYFYMDGELDISIIYNKTKRKELMRIKESEMEVIAQSDAKELDYFDNVKIVDCSAKEKKDKTYAIICHCNNQWRKVVIQENEELLNAFKCEIPDKVKLQ